MPCTPVLEYWFEQLLCGTVLATTLIVAVAVKETRLRDSSRTLLPTKERLADFVLTLKCEENVVNRDRLTIRAGLP